MNKLVIFSLFLIGSLLMGTSLNMNMFSSANAQGMGQYDNSYQQSYGNDPYGSSYDSSYGYDAQSTYGPQKPSYDQPRHDYRQSSYGDYSDYKTKDKKYECRTGPFEGFFVSSVEFCLSDQKRPSSDNKSPISDHKRPSSDNKSPIIKTFNCINANLNGNNTGSINIGNKSLPTTTGEGNLIANAYGNNGAGYNIGSNDDGYKQGKNLDCIINNNNTNTIINNNTNSIINNNNTIVVDFPQRPPVDIPGCGGCFQDLVAGNQENIEALQAALEQGIFITIINVNGPFNTLAQLCTFLNIATSILDFPGINEAIVHSAVMQIITQLENQNPQADFTPTQITDFEDCLLEVLGIST